MPVTEEEVALAVLAIAEQRADGIASFDQIRDEAPRHLALDSEDLAQSDTRPNEPMWHQKIRNIQSHYESPGNFIHDGYLVHVSGVGYQILMQEREGLRAGVRNTESDIRV